MTIKTKGAPMRMTTLELPAEPYHLKAGGHTNRQEGMCFNEMIAYLAGEKHSAWPDCTDPIIEHIGMTLNDRLDDTRRQLLLPLAYRSLGTANDGRQEERRQMVNEWLLHEALPTWLDAAGWKEAAERLRALPVDLAATAVLSELRIARSTAWQAREDALERIREATRVAMKAELEKRGLAVAAVAVGAVAVAAVAAVAVGAVAVAAGAVGAIGAVVATGDAVAAVAAVAAGDVGAIGAVGAAVAAGAVGAAVADGALKYGSADYWRVRDAAYSAAYGIYHEKTQEAVKPIADKMVPSILDLMDRMLPVSPLLAPVVANAAVLCGVGAEA